MIPFQEIVYLPLDPKRASKNNTESRAELELPRFPELKSGTNI